jgi:hypothetical protein
MSVKRLVPLHTVALSTDPINSRIGDIYYNTLDSILKYYDGTEWNEIGGGIIEGLLDHIHTYDGDVFTVYGNKIISSGLVDAGNPNTEAAYLPNILDGLTPETSYTDVLDGGEA